MRPRAAVVVLVVVFAGIGWLSALGIAGMLPMGGAKLGLLVASVCIVSPLIFLIWTRWPLIAPFCLYAAVVPFEEFPLGGIGGVPRLVGSLSFLALVFTLLIRRDAGKPPRAVWVWALAGLWMATTLAWAEILPTAGPQVEQIVQLVGFGFVLSIMRVSLLELNAVVLATILGGFAASLLEIFLFRGGSTMSHLTGAEARACIQVAGGCLDGNFFAAGLLLPITLAIVGSLRSRTLLSKVLFLVPSLVGMFAVFISGSRGAFTALSAGLLYLLLRTRYRLQLAGVIIAGLLASLASPVIWARFSDPSQGEASGRFEYWRVGLLAFRDHWLLGAGMGSYRAAYEAAYLRVFEVQAFHTFSQDPHNLLVQTGVELGVIGLVLVLGAWAFQFRMLGDIPKGNPLFDLRCALEAATIALFVMAFSVDLMTFKFTWLCFYVAFLTRSAAQALPQPARAAPLESPAPQAFARVGRRRLPTGVADFASVRSK